MRGIFLKTKGRRQFALFKHIVSFLKDNQIMGPTLFIYVILKTYCLDSSPLSHLLLFASVEQRNYKKRRETEDVHSDGVPRTTWSNI